MLPSAKKVGKVEQQLNKIKVAKGKGKGKGARARQPTRTGPGSSVQKWGTIYDPTLSWGKMPMVPPLLSHPLPPLCFPCVQRGVISLEGVEADANVECGKRARRRHAEASVARSPALLCYLALQQQDLVGGGKKYFDHYAKEAAAYNNVYDPVTDNHSPDLTNWVKNDPEGRSKWWVHDHMGRGY